MIIHVVKRGDTIPSISKIYGIPEERLRQDNDIKVSDRLVIGQTIVIVYPKQSYTIREGDTLQDIADKFGVSIMQLLRNNPFLSDREFIYPGETIVVSYEDNKIGTLSTNGYAYPYIDNKVLRRTLPFLTYISIYSYMYNEKGELNDINDTQIIQIAKAYGAAPIMVLTGLSPEDINVLNVILLEPQLQEQFIINVLTVLKNKGYYGVNISAQYINPRNRGLFPGFIEKFTSRMKVEGFIVFVTLSFNSFDTITSTFYEEFNYEKIGNLVNGIVIMGYAWGISMDFPSISMPIELFRFGLEYASMLVPVEKLWLGLSLIGYVWELPYVTGVSKGQSLSIASALELARQFDSEIKYNDITKTAYFHYVMSYHEYVVQFRDARGIDSYLKLVSGLGYTGVGLWNIMNFYAQMWLICNTQYEIVKVL